LEIEALEMSHDVQSADAGSSRAEGRPALLKLARQEPPVSRTTQSINREETLASITSDTSKTNIHSAHRSFHTMEHNSNPVPNVTARRPIMSTGIDKASLKNVSLPLRVGRA
jgi:hypothetical protein